MAQSLPRSLLDDVQAINWTQLRRLGAWAAVALVAVLTVIIAASSDYLRAEFTSRLLGFVDDAEFHLPHCEPVIHMRSASRLGYSDLGANRRRLEEVRRRFPEASAKP